MPSSVPATPLPVAPSSPSALAAAAEATRLEAAGDAAPDAAAAASLYERALWMRRTRPLFAKLVAAVDRQRAADPGYLFATHTLSRRLTVVTAADAGYAGLLDTMLSTVRFLRGAPALRLAVYDVGLEPDQARRLRADGMTVVTPDWHLPRALEGRYPSHFKAMTARPYLPRYFPDSALFLWIDADVWVQEPRCLDDIVLGALCGALSIVSERHRAYSGHFLPLGETRKISEREWLNRLYSETFGAEDAAVLEDKPVLNSGVFALRAGAPHWTAWQETLAAALRRTRIPLVEQTALNHAVYRRGLPTVQFGALYNWVTHRARPRYDPAARLFLEPTPPFRPLGLIHVTGPGKEKPRRVTTVGGGTLQVPLLPPRREPA
ncbi:hypothetical protein [Azospirillum sp. A39]|uniref:hypothetical protein n=1 Tax=Azospirillum sp. A39 TaxID=3462279 RepID=UPI00404609FF